MKNAKHLAQMGKSGGDADAASVCGTVLWISLERIRRGFPQTARELGVNDLIEAVLKMPPEGFSV